MPRAFLLLCVATCSYALHAHAMTLKPPHPAIEELQRRAFNYFWLETSATTGLTRDRASNSGRDPVTNNISSIAATGYMLASLPIGVRHTWVPREKAYKRALTALQYIHDNLQQQHGFYYHFVDWNTGRRAWKSEISSIDTAVLALGALVAGTYWHGTDVDTIATDIVDRMDWTWMRTMGGSTPDALAPAMGWKPESGWIKARWQGYNESALLYLLALGTAPDGLPKTAWDAWQVPTAQVEGVTVLGGPAPLFWAQMTPAFINLSGKHDRHGRDWWSMWRNAHIVDQTYCAQHPRNATYAAGFWGITASDSPTGYSAAVPQARKNNGTVSPSSMVAAVLFTPEHAKTALTRLWSLRKKIWGAYGFCDAFNLQHQWYDNDVIGIDLGTMLLATENAQTGFIWNLLQSNSTVQRGLSAAGFVPGSARGNGP